MCVNPPQNYGFSEVLNIGGKAGIRNIIHLTPLIKQFHITIFSKIHKKNRRTFSPWFTLGHPIVATPGPQVKEQLLQCVQSLTSSHPTNTPEEIGEKW